MNNNGELNTKQKRFCEEILVDNNATQAAIRAGYSQRSASSIGNENLKKPKIQKYINELKEARSLRTQVTADRILQELATMAFAKKGIKPGHKLKALGMLGNHVGIFDNQPNLEKQARTVYVPKMDTIEENINESIRCHKRLVLGPDVPIETRLDAHKQYDRFLLGLAKLSIVDPKSIQKK